MMVSITRDQNVVVFSEPGETMFQMCHQSDFGYSESADDSQDYFVIRPFSNESSSIYIASENNVPVEVNDLKLDLPVAPSILPVERSEYANRVETAISRLKDPSQKVVLSRIAVQRLKTFDVGRSLQQLRDKFPDALVYLVNTSSHGTWLGATPEHLLMNDGDDYQTMALAGTKWGDALFTQKEFDEQFSVTKAIVDALKDQTIEVSDIEECEYGDLRHLRTYIRWQSDKPMLHFAERFHPTPAVCGYPNHQAKMVIDELEQHDRQLYTGYLGMLRRGAKCVLFVNLRCMQLFRDALLMYVGGGINTSSIPTSEWEETERKKSAVLSALVYE